MEDSREKTILVFSPHPDDDTFAVGGTHWGAPAAYFYPYRGMQGQELRYVPDLESGSEDGQTYLTTG